MDRAPGFYPGQCGFESCQRYEGLCWLRGTQVPEVDSLGGTVPREGSIPSLPHGVVTQLVRVPSFQVGGCGFESHLPFCGDMTELVRFPTANRGYAGSSPAVASKPLWRNWLTRHPLKVENPGSSPGSGTLPLWLNWLEQRTFNPRVPGSSPGGGTMDKTILIKFPELTKSGEILEDGLGGKIRAFPDLGVIKFPITYLFFHTVNLLFLRNELTLDSVPTDMYDRYEEFPGELI